MDVYALMLTTKVQISLHIRSVHSLPANGIIGDCIMYRRTEKDAQSDLGLQCSYMACVPLHILYII